MRHVVIIGGGLAGLAAAHRLREIAPTIRVTLLEVSARLGGIIGTERTDGFVIEQGPDSILTEKPWAMDLIRRLDLEPDVVRTQAHPRGAYVVCRGRLEPVPSGFSLLAPTEAWPILRSSILSWRGKIRLAGDLILPRGPSGEDESLASFVSRRFGREVLDRLAQPLVAGIYGADSALLSLGATMPRFLDAEREHRSVILGLRKRTEQTRSHATGARYGLFIALREGMQSLTDRLAEKSGAQIHTGQSVTRVARVESGWAVETSDGGPLEADAVVVAIPAWRAAALVRDIDPSLGEDLGRVAHGSSAIVSFAWRRSDVPHPLDAFGFVVPLIERRRILACTWSSEKYPGRAPDDHVLLRVFFGPSAGSLLLADDDTLIRAGHEELRDLLGIRAQPAFVRVVRSDRGLPQYHVGHLALVERIESAVADLRGFALAGGAYRGVGIPDVIHYAERAAEKVASDNAWSSSSVSGFVPSPSGTR